MPDLYVIAMIVVPVHLPVLLMPGANAALVSSIGLLYGRKAAVRAAIGITTGSTILITIALLFANTIFNLSPQTLFAIKVVGALYLLYLAILALRPPKTKPKKRQSAPLLVWHADRSHQPPYYPVFYHRAVSRQSLPINPASPDHRWQYYYQCYTVISCCSGAHRFRKNHQPPR